MNLWQSSYFDAQVHSLYTDCDIKPNRGKPTGSHWCWWSFSYSQEKCKILFFGFNRFLGQKKLFCLQHFEQTRLCSSFKKLHRQQKKLRPLVDSSLCFAEVKARQITWSKLLPWSRVSRSSRTVVDPQNFTELHV